MPAGLRGFAKERLVMAREARGYRQHEVAGLIGRSPATISKWESGAQTPDPLVVGDLCKALNVYPNWFFRGSALKDETFFFRSLVSELELMRTRMRARLGFVEAIGDLITKYIDLPDVDIPNLVTGDDFKYLRDDDIEGIADEIRLHWEIEDGPVKDLLLIIENAGVIVGEDNIGSVKLDGISFRSNYSKRPYMLLAKDKRSGTRRRYDAAHELSHLILHQAVSREDLLTHFHLIESQAMQLAGALLMPAREFRSSVYSISLESLLELKKDWGVSVGAMIKRLANLGEISPHNERRLWQYYSKKRWRTGEPNEAFVPIEVPENMKTAITMLTSDGSFSRQGFLSELGLLAEDVAMLCGIEVGFFEQGQRSVRQTPRLKDDLDLFGDSNIVRFPRKE